MVSYRGTDRRGAGVTGTLREGEDQAAFVQRKFRQGWLRLTVMRDGVEAGGIAPALWSRDRRIWWSE